MVDATRSCKRDDARHFQCSGREITWTQTAGKTKGRVYSLPSCCVEGSGYDTTWIFIQQSRHCITKKVDYRGSGSVCITV